MLLNFFLLGLLDANRPVPFRLTPPLQSFITQIGITGPLQLSMLATARCFVQPLYGLENILKAILRDEFIAWKKVRDDFYQRPDIKSHLFNIAIIQVYCTNTGMFLPYFHTNYH